MMLQGEVRFFATGRPLWHSKGGVRDGNTEQLSTGGGASAYGDMHLDRARCCSNPSDAGCSSYRCKRSPLGTWPDIRSD